MFIELLCTFAIIVFIYLLYKSFSKESFNDYLNLQHTYSNYKDPNTNNDGLYSNQDISKNKTNVVVNTFYDTKKKTNSTHISNNHLGLTHSEPDINTLTKRQAFIKCPPNTALQSLVLETTRPRCPWSNTNKHHHYSKYKYDCGRLSYKVKPKIYYSQPTIIDIGNTSPLGNINIQCKKDDKGRFGYLKSINLEHTNPVDQECMPGTEGTCKHARYVYECLENKDTTNLHDKQMCISKQTQETPIRNMFDLHFHEVQCPNNTGLTQIQLSQEKKSNDIPHNTYYHYKNNQVPTTTILKDEGNTSYSKCARLCDQNIQCGGFATEINPNFWDSSKLGSCKLYNNTHGNLQTNAKKHFLRKIPIMKYKYKCCSSY